MEANITAHYAKLCSAKLGSFPQHRIPRNPRQRVKQKGKGGKHAKGKIAGISMLGSLAGARKGKAKAKAEKIKHMLQYICTALKEKKET